MPPSSFGKEVLVLLNTDSTEALHTALAAIERLGGRIVHAHPPRVLIGHIPAEIEPQVRSLANVAGLFRGRMKLAEYEDLGEQTLRAIKGWNRTFAASLRALKAGRPGDGKSWGAPGYAAEGPARPPKEGSAKAPFPDRPAPVADTSAYLIGKVTASIILVEGSAPPYRFTNMERDTIVAEIQDGLGWLGSIEPKAQVSWFYDYHQVSLDLEPAQTPDFSEDTWRDAAMSLLGYPGSWQGLEQFVLERKAALGTEWGMAIFITRFPLWHFAYAFKPRVVLNYDLDGWGIDDMDRVVAHETCHIFGAADEYAESKCDPSERFGYLQVENGNCELGTANHMPCIMSHNTWAMCEYTRGQLGWRDSNGDGIFDPLDTPTPTPPFCRWRQLLEWLRRWLGLTPANLMRDA